MNDGYRVVKRYASALFEVSKEAMASNPEALNELQLDIEALNKLMDEVPEIREFCLLDNHSMVKSRMFIEKAVLPYLGELTQKTVIILQQNNRLAALPFLADALQKELFLYNGVTPVIVETVSEPDENFKKDIQKALKNIIPGKVETEWKVRKDLLGGLTFQWDNRVLDLSVKNRLANFKRTLNRKSV
ncbi:MAG: ATP synthase F1 subunit delta [Spirochaetales bacterium]|nr:ATP synthase F1 subunit delta [Spirochaetales bacterium]